MKKQIAPRQAATMTLDERCDRCPAAAQLRAHLPSGDLLFCGHHARKHWMRLIEVGATFSS